MINSSGSIILKLSIKKIIDRQDNVFLLPIFSVKI